MMMPEESRRQSPSGRYHGVEETAWARSEVTNNVNLWMAPLYPRDSLDLVSLSNTRKYVDSRRAPSSQIYQKETTYLTPTIIIGFSNLTLSPTSTPPSLNQLPKSPTALPPLEMR